jgi:hypothetical protein
MLAGPDFNRQTILMTPRVLHNSLLNEFVLSVSFKRLKYIFFIEIISSRIELRRLWLHPDSGGILIAASTGLRRHPNCGVNRIATAS